MKKNYMFHLAVWVYILFMHFGQQTFSFMGLNVFLAWLPILFAQLFIQIKDSWRWIFVPLWLLFFPNIPYLMTDLFHLAALRIYQPGGHFLMDSQGWWSYLLLALPIVLMVFIGMAQVFKLFSTIQLSKKQKVSSVTVLALLSSIAIYIGRFDRVHSGPSCDCFEIINRQLVGRKNSICLDVQHFTVGNMGTDFLFTTRDERRIKILQSQRCLLFFRQRSVYNRASILVEKR